MKVAIVGGGVSGLSAAYELQKSGVEFTLFESSARLGGVIRTESVGNFLMEAGPDSFLSEKPAARELCSELGLEGELIGSNDLRRKTYVVVNGKLIPLPDGLQFFVPTDPLATFFSPLFPLAHLGLARAAVLNGDAAKARQSYQDFFALWKDADPTIPILVEAHQEYDKLK